MKRANKYHLKLELLETAKGESGAGKSLELTFTNHDEVFGIIERIKEKQRFDEQEATEFAIGLKMFSEVMIRNRNHHLFQELAPAFQEFMKRLKSTPAAGEATTGAA